MQPKVSIVIPCYNKVKWMGNTFESVLSQRWDNIELIIINDGSTDGTRDIITAYEPKLRERGYEVLIIDQENQGLAASVRNGLMRITGEFVCQLDAEDEVDAGYVSTMAGWLAENPGYDWAACDSYLVSESSTVHRKSFPGGEKDCTIENWLFGRIIQGLWIYMIRSDYLKRLNVIETFYIGRDAYQEQQVIYPLIVGKGKLKYFPIPMHKQSYYESETHMSHLGTYERVVETFFGLYNADCQTIKHLDIDEKDKLRFVALAELNLSSKIIMYSKRLLFNSRKYEEWQSKLIELVNCCFTISEQFNFGIVFDNIALFRIALVDNIMSICARSIDYLHSGRIIAWGALGNNAGVLLPQLRGTPLEPTELWDIAGDGVKIKKPSVESLTEGDIVFILPIRHEEISAKLEAAGFDNFLIASELQMYAAPLIFPQFYDGSVRFIHQIQK